MRPASFEESGTHGPPKERRSSTVLMKIMLRSLIAVGHGDECHREKYYCDTVDATVRLKTGYTDNQVRKGLGDPSAPPGDGRSVDLGMGVPVSGCFVSDGFSPRGMSTLRNAFWSLPSITSIVRADPGFGTLARVSIIQPSTATLLLIRANSFSVEVIE